MLVEGRHFLPHAEPHALGHKALAVNLSDLAAMGAKPRWALLALGVPAVDEKWLAAFSDGLFALAGRHGVELVGGDTVRAPQRTISITALGEVPAGAALLRGGAKAGDDIWVSGELGGAALALAHPELAEVAARLHAPEPRVGLGKRLRRLASAAIDVSDGLASDLGHILERSQVGATIEYDRIPRPAALGRFGTGDQEQWILSGGDDYELIFTAAPDRRDEVMQISGALKLALSRIGSITAGAGKLQILDASGRPMTARGGFDHFGT
jgi:thiamine-monophosphate kinase